MKKLLLHTLLIACAVTVQANADAVPAGAASQQILIPRINGKWTHVYQPGSDVFPGPDSNRFKSGHRYADWQVNDHSILKGPDGRWHAIGITHPAVNQGDQDPHEAEWLSFHAVSPVGTLKQCLAPGSWTDQAKILPPSERPGEITSNHAPYILRHGNEYVMVYGPSPIRYATSRDLRAWTPRGELFREKEGARDPSILEYGGRFYLAYATLQSVRVRTSADLVHWSEPTTVFSLPPGELGGAESPTLLALHGGFYLIWCRWDPKIATDSYQDRSFVYYSNDPLNFRDRAPVAELSGHAPELFKDEDGAWWISSAERPARGVSIAPVKWERLNATAGEQAGRPAVPQFQAGDRWCVLGDSITHGGSYHQQVELFHLTRHPKQPLEVFNCGIGGDSAPGATKRLSWDCLNFKPTVVSVMLGMNDVSGEYPPQPPKNPELDPKRIQRAAGCERAMRILTQSLLKSGARVVLIRPSIYDDTALLPQANNCGRGAGLAGFGQRVQSIADELKLPTVDFNGPMTVINAEQQKRNPSFTIVGPDRVHPGGPGHFVMAYEFLKAQKETGVVSRVTVDAAAGRAGMLENCEVSEVRKEAGGISFTALEHALPFPVDDGARPALAWVPFTKEFNQETLLIRGLNAGDFELSIDGKPVRKFTAAELAGGVNLAEEIHTPQYQQALGVRAALAKKWSAVSKLRTISLIEHGAWQGAPHPVTLEQMQPKLDQQAVHVKGKPWAGYILGEQKKYRELKASEAAFPREVEAAVGDARAAAQPKPHRFSLRRVTAP